MFEKSTEKTSKYDHLEQMSTGQLLTHMNEEDQTVAKVVEGLIPAITALVDQIVPRLQEGGRLFYIGAGTSGRLGILDASECPPTFGVPREMVIGLIAGGDKAIRRAVEHAEDDTTQGWKDLEKHKVGQQDVVIGIAASGTTPYVIGALESCNKNGILTGGITCNDHSPLAQTAKHPLVAVVGPEFVTGSTRMKAGTAQKLIVNMISTSTMIKLGRVVGNKMVDMQLSNAKLVERAIRMIKEDTAVGDQEASELLKRYGSVRKAVEAFKKENQW